MRASRKQQLGARTVLIRGQGWRKRTGSADVAAVTFRQKVQPDRDNGLISDLLGERDMCWRFGRAAKTAGVPLRTYSGCRCLPKQGDADRLNQNIPAVSLTSQRGVVSKS